jgi:hypothetical protein
MKMKTTLRGTAALIACLSLSACFGSSNGGGAGAGGGGGAGGATGYDAKFGAIENTIATTTQMTGSVDYAGQTKVMTFAEGSNGVDSNGTITGDVALNANFDTGAVSGTATNFAGTVDGKDITLTGTLDTANSAFADTSMAYSTAVPPIPGIPQTQGLYGSGFTADMRGELTNTETDDKATATLNLLGSVVGTDGAAAWGPASLTVNNVVDQGSLGFDLGSSGGTFYVERE